MARKKTTPDLAPPPAAEERLSTEPHIWVKTFLKAFEQTGQWAISAKMAEVTYNTVKRLYASDDIFRDKCDEAREIGIDLIILEIKRRGFAGSDNLLMFLAKGARPHIYRDNYNVANTSAPTNYILDLTLPADSDYTQTADQTADSILEG